MPSYNIAMKNNKIRLTIKTAIGILIKQCTIVTDIKYIIYALFSIKLFTLLEE